MGTSGTRLILGRGAHPAGWTSWPRADRWTGWTAWAAEADSTPDRLTIYLPPYRAWPRYHLQLQGGHSSRRWWICVFLYPVRLRERHNRPQLSLTPVKFSCFIFLISIENIKKDWHTDSSPNHGFVWPSGESLSFTYLIKPWQLSTKSIVGLTQIQTAKRDINAQFYFIRNNFS